MLLAAVLLGLAWLIAPQPSPPLYDGIGLPVEPYRYLNPPKGVTSKVPTSVQQRLKVSNGQQPYVFLATRETPPQAIMNIDQNSMVVPRGVSTLQAVVRPVLPPASPPGKLDGNVYLFRVAPPGGQELAFRSGQEAEIQLRETGQKGNPVMEWYNGNSWERQPTANFVNSDYLAAQVPHLGYFALIFSGSGGGGGNSLLPILLLGLAVVVLAVLGLIAIRLSRRRASG